MRETHSAFRKPTYYLWLFFCGSVAISAMVLPGVSGSFVLLLFGVYFEIIATINNIRLWVKGVLKQEGLNLDGPILHDFAVLGSTMLGLILGILLFVRLLDYLLKHFYNQTIAMLIGLMLGSLYGVWPFRERQTIGDEVIDGLPIPPAIDTNFFLTLLTAAAGVAIIFIFLSFDKKKEASKAEVDHAEEA